MERIPTKKKIKPSGDNISGCQVIQLQRKSAERKGDLDIETRVYLERTSQADPFTEMYKNSQVLKPPYDPIKLYRIKEESDTLTACIDAMKSNVEGFGYDIVYTGTNPENRNSDEAKRQYDRLFDFFDNINENESYTQIAMKKREDKETLGYAAYEAIRARDKSLFALYHAPTIYIRIVAYNKDIDTPVDISLPVRRNGVVRKIKMRRQFKRFCQILPWTQEVRFFKELGDPRILDYKTGLFDPTTTNKATELMFMSLPFGGESAYGMPRWSGAILDARGRTASQFLNFDLMDNQGIPPLAVLVTGGLLTQESWTDLQNIFKNSKGRENFNKTLVLEAIPEMMGLDEKSNVKLDFKNLTEFRKEDQMFGNYQDKSLENMRRCFRLPPLYTGDARSYNLASARSSQLISEQQIFAPERNLVDEEINRLIVGSEFGIYDWAFRGKGARIVGSEEIALAVEKFSKAGALSINSAITIANEAFGLAIPTYNEEWATLPLAIVQQRMAQEIASEGIGGIDDNTDNTTQEDNEDNIDADANTTEEENRVA